MRPLFDAELVDQRVGIDVVEAVAGRNIGRAVLEDRREVRVFAVEVEQVGAEVALLQQIAGAREVVDPRAGLLGPGLVAVEPLAERPERHARGFVLPTSGWCADS